MDRETTLIAYTESIQSNLEQIQHELVADFNRIEKNSIWKELGELCQKVEKVQREEPDYRLEYIQISLLCAGIASDEFYLSLRAYNQDYFLDQHSIQTVCNISGWFPKLVEFKKKLYDSWSSISKIELFDIDKIIVDLAVGVNHKLAERFRPFFWDFDEESFVASLTLGSKLLVKWGFEREYSETVFKSVNEDKDSLSFDLVQQELQDETVMPELHYLCWDHDIIQEVQVKKKALLFQSFRYGQIENSVFADSILLGSTFKGCNIKNGGFLGCNLEKCNFQKANFDTIAFALCNLQGSDFRGASFKEVSFNGCNMDGAIFSSSSIPYLKLDSKDLQRIVIKGDQ